jgi:hypothetical protein
MKNVVYAPPKSAAHGHGSRARSARKAWSAVQAFLSDHTVAELQPPLKLTVFGPNEWSDHAVAQATIDEAVKTFGSPSSTSDMSYDWQLPTSRLAEAFEFALADDRRPKQALGPTTLYVVYSFAWRDLPFGPTLANTRHVLERCLLAVSVGGRRVFLQPTFRFASSLDDKTFVKELSALELDMPFTPRDDFYYVVEAKKSGRGYKTRKLHKGWKSLS